MNKLEQKVRSNKTAKQKKTKKLQTTINYTRVELQHEVAPQRVLHR